MKWLVWILIVFNVVLFGYPRLSEMAASGQPGQAPLQAERMQLLTPEQLAAIPESAPATPVDSLACYEWGSFPDASVARARNVLDQFGLEFSVKQMTAGEAVRYWTYIPPLKSLQEAQVRSNALSAMGIKDIYVVQDARWRYAISLGIFRDEAPAARLAQELRNRGVRDAVSGTRSAEGGQNSFMIRNMLVSRAQEIDRLKPDFPYAELRQTACE